MRRTILCLAGALLFSSFSRAQEIAPKSFWNAQIYPVRHFEGEFYAGATLPFGGVDGTKAHMGPAMGLELRYNFAQKPFDLGLLIDITTAVHQQSAGTYTLTQSNRTCTLGLVCDWNFAQGRKVNPYAGLGVGVGFHNVLNDWIDPYGDQTATFPTLIPRIGVELFSHLRVGLSSHITARGYDNVQLSIGLVLGGRPKKSR